MGATNEEMIKAWNEELAEAWVRRREQLDAPAAPLGHEAMDALALEPGMTVLDVGCGTGGTTRELADRVSPGGSVTGVDVSRPMLKAARELAAGRQDVRFVEGDAQTADLGRGVYDGVFSRFGVMFFDDPVAAFGNIREATKPDGRLAFVCWRDALLNPCMSAPVMAAIPICGPPEMPADPHAPGPFSFADRDRVRDVLRSAGWSDVEVEPLDIEFRFQTSAEELLDLMMEIGPLGSMTAEADDETKARVREAALEVLRSFETSGTVATPSATWLVTARR
ncbi:MAG TPA: class I SAM-dependent methyltransferase [Actinomycetota bacterium]|nr:class I SAM-dependent methyltransferase [Actinomycetota bacterium]